MPINSPMDVLGIAASGLHSAEVRLAASAHNVANLTTESYRPVRVMQREGDIGGSTARIDQTASPRPVDLVHEVVEQSQASFQYKASLHLFAVEFELRGQLFNALV